MAFTALKPCRFGGTLYEQGDFISQNVIDKKMVKKLVGAKKIRPAEIGAAGGASDKGAPFVDGEADKAAEGMKGKTLDDGALGMDSYGETAGEITGEPDTAEKSGKKNGKK